MLYYCIEIITHERRVHVCWIRNNNIIFLSRASSSFGNDRARANLCGFFFLYFSFRPTPVCTVLAACTGYMVSKYNTHTRVRVYRLIVPYLNITRVDDGGGGGVSGLPRRAPRIEIDHKATAATAADLIIGFLIGRPDSLACVQGARGTTIFNRDDDNYYYLRRIVVLPPRLLDWRESKNNHRRIKKNKF